MSKGLRTAALIVGAVAVGVVTAGVGLAATGAATSVSSGIAMAGSAIGVSFGTLATISGALGLAASLTAKTPEYRSSGSPDILTLEQPNEPCQSLRSG